MVDVVCGALENEMECSRTIVACLHRLTSTAFVIVFVLMASSTNSRAQNAPQSSAAGAVARPAGTIKAINGNAITLTGDGGSEINIVVQDSARLVAVAPGEKDLQNAKPLELHDLQPGDRVVVRGTPGADGKTILATSVLVMKKTDVAEKLAHEQEDWRKNGIGGLVHAVDPASNTITVAVTAAAGAKDLTIRATKGTVVRRYAPDSVQFDKATVSSLDQIKPGDQLRARGSRGAGEGEFIADEIVT